MKFEVCSPVSSVAVRDASTNLTGNVNADAELTVLQDANTESFGGVRLSVGVHEEPDSFTADSMIAVAVRSDSSCRVVGGHGSAELRNMNLTGERQVQAVRNAPKFFVRPIVRDELGNTGFKSAILDSWNQEDNLYGTSSHLVWDYYNSTGNSISPHDQTIIGYPDGLMKVRLDPTTNQVKAYLYDFGSQTFSSGETIATGVRNQTAFTDDTSPSGTPLDYNISPSGFYDEESGKVFVAITTFNYATLSLEHSIYSGTPGGNDWRKISTQASLTSLNLQKQVEQISFYLQADISNLRFISNQSGLLSYFEVEIVDNGVETGDSASASVIGGYLLSIEIDAGVTTIGTIYDVISASGSISASLTVQLLGSRGLIAEIGSQAADIAGSEIDYDFSAWSSDSDIIYPAQNLITAFNGFQNRTRLVRGPDRWALITSVIVQYDMDIMVYVTSGGGAFETESTSREFYSLTSIISHDNGATWQDLGSPKMIESPSPLQRAAQDLLTIQSSSRKYGANLFDLFDVGAQNSGLSDLYGTVGYTYDRQNRNPWFSAYFDDTMGEFVIAKRADGVSELRDSMIFIASDGNYGRWRPIGTVQFREDAIDTDYSGASFQVSDVTIVPFQQDMNYMVLDGWYENLGYGDTDGPFGAAQVVTIPFKFFSNRRVSYNSAIDSLGQERPDYFVVPCGRDYTLLYGKFAAQLSAVVPNVAVVQGVDDDRRATQYPHACSFQDQLVVEFEGQPSNGRMFGITQQWVPWFEQTPYQNVEIPCVADDPISATYTPDLTFWNMNLSDPSAVVPSIAGHTYRFTTDDGYGAGYSSKTYELGGVVAMTDTFKCRTSIKIVSTSGGVSSYMIPFMSCRLNKGVIESYWIGLRLEQALAQNPKIVLWDYEANDEVASWTDDAFDPSDEWQIFMYAHTGGVELLGVDGSDSALRVEVYGRKVTTGVDGRWRLLIDRNFAVLTPGAASFTGFVEWGATADEGSVAPAVTGVSSPRVNFAMRYFSHSWFTKSEYTANAGEVVRIGNPFVATGRPVNNTTQYSYLHEGLHSSDFSSRYGAPPFGRKCRSVNVVTPFGYDLSFEGSVRDKSNFLVGRYGERFDISDLVSGPRYKQYVTPPLVADDQFILDLKFSNISQEKYDYIAFVNCELYDFDIDIAAAIDDEAVLSTIQDVSYNYVELDVDVVGYDFVTFDTSIDLMSRFDSSRSYAIFTNNGAAQAIMNVVEIGHKFIVVDVSDPRYEQLDSLTFDQVRLYRRDFIVPIGHFFTSTVLDEFAPSLLTIYAPSTAATGNFDTLESERRIGKVLFLRRDDVSDLVESVEESSLDTVVQETLRRRYSELQQRNRKVIEVSMFAGSDSKRKNASRTIDRFLRRMSNDTTVVLLKRNNALTLEEAEMKELASVAPDTEQVVAIELTTAEPSVRYSSSSGSDGSTLTLTLHES